MHFPQQLSTEGRTLDKQIAQEQIESACIFYLVITFK